MDLYFSLAVSDGARQYIIDSLVHFRYLEELWRDKYWGWWGMENSAGETYPWPSIQRYCQVSSIIMPENERKNQYLEEGLRSYAVMALLLK